MEHTRNQKRMYRIKKLEEKIVDLENISKKAINELDIANDKLKKIEEYIIKDNYKEEEIWCSDVIPILKIIKGDEEE